MSSLINIRHIVIIITILLLNHVIAQASQAPKDSNVASIGDSNKANALSTDAGNTSTKKGDDSGIPWYSIGIGACLVVGVILIGVGVFLLTNKN